MRPLLIAIHGILTCQTRADWPDLFDAWCEREAVPAHVLKKEYEAGPLPWWNVLVKNRGLAQGLAAEVEAFPAAMPLHFVAHSNGTDIALKTIKLLAARGIPTKTFIAIGSILEPEITRNGIHDLIEFEDLGRAIAYTSESDSAIGITEWPLLRSLTAYRDLGRTGWKYNGVTIPAERFGATAFDPRPLDAGLLTRRFKGFDHGDYFINENRERIFDLIRKDCAL